MLNKNIGKYKEIIIKILIFKFEKIKFDIRNINIKNNKLKIAVA